jgi:ElaB/YqjD/DUF883 family membrane-anchored ribosome-binding protein
MSSSDSTSNHSTGSEYMNVVADMAEKMKDKARESMNRSQQAVIEAMENWAQVTQTIMSTPPVPPTSEAMPKPTKLVDRGFEIAEQLLAAQHSFAKKLMESVQGPMSDAAAKTASAAQDVNDAGTASARAAANGASDANATVTETVKKTFAKG